VCILGSHFESPVVSAVQSRQQDEGGASWLRTIVRRHHGYCVVIDELRAHMTMCTASRAGGVRSIPA